ncbi:MAG: DUF427 domain-containing protein [Pseudomonadota bacterium]
MKPHRDKWGPLPADVTPEPAGPDEESVWDYPRPPAVRDAPAPARVVFDGREIAASRRALRIVETAGAPVYYFPPENVDVSVLRETNDISVCEWKGAAAYFDLVSGKKVSKHAAFAYPDPLDDLGEGYARIAGWYGFYPARVDACYVGDEKVHPQSGNVYAGWVTSKIKGPIKGAPGTGHW